MLRKHGFVVAALWLASLLAAGTAGAQLRGHGGPVRSLAVARDGLTALSGSFDTAAILWDLRGDTARQVLRFHDSAVNAVALLPDGSPLTAGADARIALWTPGRSVPDRVLAGHRGPIAALALSPDGGILASAAWDRTVRLWPLLGGAPVVIEGQGQNINGVAFLPDGKAVVSAGYDATVRIWPLPQPASPIVTRLPAPLNAVAVAPDGEIVAAGADGEVYFLSPTGKLRGAVAVSPSPIVALAMTRGGRHIAAASIDGAVYILDRQRRSAMRTLIGAGPSVWAAAFLPDGRTLLTGGNDRVIHRWNVETGQPVDPVASGAVADPLAAYAGDPGARVFRGCVACHALTAGAGDRAGPSLHGLFGRRIASLPGYRYSEALRRLDIVWTPATVAKLFELGPARYTPGTKMPEQRIGSPEDRDRLVKFLERATK